LLSLAAGAFLELVLHFKGGCGDTRARTHVCVCVRERASACSQTPEHFGAAFQRLAGGFAWPATREQPATFARHGGGAAIVMRAVFPKFPSKFLERFRARNDPCRTRRCGGGPWPRCFYYDAETPSSCVSFIIGAHPHARTIFHCTCTRLRRALGRWVSSHLSTCSQETYTHVAHSSCHVHHRAAALVNNYFHC
jgi:hypothetical protein